MLLALMHDSVYEGATFAASFEDENDEQTIVENYVLDIGAKTQERWKGIIGRASAVIVAGLPGAAQYEEFQDGTRAPLEAIAAEQSRREGFRSAIIDKAILENIEGIGVSPGDFAYVSHEGKLQKRICQKVQMLSVFS